MTNESPHGEVSLLKANVEGVAPWLPWGKLQRQSDGGEVVASHSLLDHMTDVAACMSALLRCMAVRRAAEVAAGRALDDEVDLPRLAVIAFLHDIGKANAGFQAKHWRQQRDVPAYWPAHGGHTTEGWVLFSEAGASVAASRILSGLPIEALASWGDGMLVLLRASISHHGRPVDEHGAASAVWRAVVAGSQVIYDPAHAVAAMGQRTHTVRVARGPIRLPRASGDGPQKEKSCRVSFRVAPREHGMGPAAGSARCVPDRLPDRERGWAPRLAGQLRPVRRLALH